MNVSGEFTKKKNVHTREAPAKTEESKLEGNTISGTEFANILAANSASYGHGRDNQPVCDVERNMEEHNLKKSSSVSEKVVDD